MVTPAAISEETSKAILFNPRLVLTVFTKITLPVISNNLIFNSAATASSNNTLIVLTYGFGKIEIVSIPSISSIPVQTTTSTSNEAEASHPFASANE